MTTVGSQSCDRGQYMSACCGERQVVLLLDDRQINPVLLMTI